MKRTVIALIALLGASTAYAQQPVPEIPFEGNINFLKLPADMNVGEVSGVAVNSKGDVAIFTRSNSAGGPAYGATASQVLLFDKTGRFVREIGKGLYAWSYAHAIRFDKDDNLWVIDEGSNMVMKFNPQGLVTLVLGRKDEAVDYMERFLEEGRKIDGATLTAPGSGAGRGGTFGRPTDVAFDLQGDIFVADGYTNSRVAKFNKDGDFVKSIGKRGNQPGEFSTPHTIANDAKGNIYVGDRGNSRIQVFDPELNPVRIISNVRSPWGICITPPNAQGQQFLFSADAGGKIYKTDLDGKLLGWFGSTGKRVGDFYWVHQMHCINENEIITGEAQNWRVQHITLKAIPKS